MSKRKSSGGGRPGSRAVPRGGGGVATMATRARVPARIGDPDLDRGDGVPRPFVWDGPALRHAIAVGRAGELLELADLVAECSGRHVTTAAVVGQLALLDLAVPRRLEVADLDAPAEVDALARWLDRTSSTPDGRVQATVCAWAEVHGGAAVLDDRGSRRVAGPGGLTRFGTLRVVAGAVASGKVAPEVAGGLIDRLIAAGARYPHGPGGFLAWAQKAGHLDQVT